jgi:protein-tyrosine-phosphatase
VVAELLTRLRRVAERVRHLLRRRRALEALRHRPRLASLLVVCHGNICRSPFAAALLRSALADRGVQVESAGFVAAGRRPPADALAAAARHGVDLSAYRSRVLTAEAARAAHLIVVMDPIQRRAIRDRFGRAEPDLLILGDLDPEAVGIRTIRDPVKQPLRVFEDTYARIDRCVRALVQGIS